MDQVSLKTAFLTDMHAVLDCIRQVLTQETSGGTIYIGGSAVKFLINHVLPLCEESDCNAAVALAFPALSGRDFTHSSYLYQLNQMAKKVRITTKATHNILLTASALVLISAQTTGKQLENDHVSGIIIQEPMEIQKARAYCDAIWSGGFPLRIG